MEANEYTLHFDDLLKLEYGKIIDHIYDAIPYQTISVEEMEIGEVRELLAYYPKLYALLARHWSLLLEKCETRIDSKWKDLRDAYKQAMSCAKLQYEALSRRITVDNEDKRLAGWQP